MKVYKIILQVIDFENLGEEGIKDELSTMKYINPHVMSVESADIGAWHDDHPLNKLDTFKEEFERIFEKKP